jgi:hypothetical protein
MPGVPGFVIPEIAIVSLQLQGPQELHGASDSLNRVHWSWTEDRKAISGNALYY